MLSKRKLNFSNIRVKNLFFSYFCKFLKIMPEKGPSKSSNIYILSISERSVQAVNINSPP